jgi:adenylylsulfate kinase
VSTLDLTTSLDNGYYMAFTVWFTGLPASGKTTLAKLVFDTVRTQTANVELFDSDVFAFTGYLDDLGDYSAVTRDVSTRILAMVSSLLNKHGISCIVAATSPRLSIRERNRKLIQHYIEVYCKCSLRVAEKRDSKGLYKVAREGLISDFTGIGERYEEPPAPEILIDTEATSIPDSFQIIRKYLEEHHYIQSIKEENIL